MTLEHFARALNMVYDSLSKPKRQEPITANHNVECEHQYLTIDSQGMLTCTSCGEEQGYYKDYPEPRDLAVLIEDCKPGLEPEDIPPDHIGYTEEF